MADTEDQTDTDLEITDEDAEKLLADPADDGSDTPDRSTSHKGDDADWKAEADKLRADTERWKRLSRQNEKSFKDVTARLKQFEDKDKSESERLLEDRDTHKTRAEKAEWALRRREIAEELAPEHATVSQIRAVAKRLAGDDDDALEKDARELFALVAPAPQVPKTPSRPKERLKGGSEPDEPVIEDDPRKLAAMIPRRR